MYRIYAENYTALTEEIKDLNKLKDIPCSWTGRLIVVKTSILFKMIQKFNIIPIRISAKIVGKYRQLILKYIWKGKGTRKAKNYFDKEK